MVVFTKPKDTEPAPASPPDEPAMPTTVAVKSCAVSAVMPILPSAITVESTLASTAFHITFAPSAIPTEVLFDAAKVPVRSVRVVLSFAYTPTVCAVAVLFSELLSLMLAPRRTNALLSPLITFDDRAPEMALSEVETEAEIMPFIISCLAVTPILTLVAAFNAILLSALVLEPMIACLSVKNRFRTNEPPTELPPPEPETARPKLRILVVLSALMPRLPVVACNTASSVIRASTSVSMTLKPKAPAAATSLVDTPPAAIIVITL